MIENYNELETREYMESNFGEIFRKYESIPLEILLEPLCRNCLVNDTIARLNLCDYKLLKICSSHPRTSLKLAINTMDLLSKIYLNDDVYAPVAL